MSSQPATTTAPEPNDRPRLQIVERRFEPAISAVITESRRLEKRWYDITKRAMDILISLFALIVASPLLALIALAVKLTSRGPIIFMHRRIGRYGVEFECYKFRTMVADAEHRLQCSRELRSQFEANFKLVADPRVTPIGNFMRRCSLDELPQFWNVLKGEMSLIGPRPIVRQELLRYGAYAKKLLSVRPGLSGLWQTCGRSETSYDLRIQMDMLYIDYRTIWLDITLIARTLSTVIQRAGAC